MRFTVVCKQARVAAVGLNSFIEVITAGGLIRTIVIDILTAWLLELHLLIVTYYVIEASCWRS